MPTFDTPEPISITVEVGVGDLQIVATDRTDTVVDVQPSDPSKPSDVAAAEQTIVEYANGALKIKMPTRWQRYSFRWGSESIDIHIEAPTGSQLRGESGVATLRATGTLGDCRYKTGAGDIIMENVAGMADIITGTGAIKIDRIAESARLKTANGDSWIGEAVGDLLVRSANGKIAVERAHAAVTVKTANGDVDLGDVAGGVIVAETALGKVHVGVRDGVAAWMDLHTGFGHVHNHLDTAEPPGPSEATVEVRARSSFGDITVRRASLTLRG